MTNEITENDGCHNCGARMRSGLCNNAYSSNYKQLGTTRCSVWIKKIHTPKEWEKIR